MTLRLLLLPLCSMCVLASSASEVTAEVSATGPVRFIVDGLDARVRRTDPCGADPLCMGDALPTTYVLPDLIRAELGRWQPNNPSINLCEGHYVSTGGFMRWVMVFKGLVHPPGQITNVYSPRQYGSDPLFGFVEFDVDTNGGTGGNTDAPLIRYNGNVARFGGMPECRLFGNRLSLDGRDPDNIYETPPWVDRSGGDFELEFRGDEITRIDKLIGDLDGQFEFGESWDIQGRFFRQAQGYDLCTGGPYTPLALLRFTHVAPTTTPAEGSDDEFGFTRVEFVFPLTNAAYSAGSIGPLNGTTGSILETMEILNILSDSCGENEYAGLIEPWEYQVPASYLQPARWRVTVLVGTARPTATASQGNYIWSDVFPNVIAGDFNGDHLRSNSDSDMADEFVLLHDGVAAFDEDGVVNQTVQLPNFGVWFSIFDVDYDGDVDASDVAFSQQASGDYDNDGDVDLKDYAAFTICATGVDMSGGSCSPSVGCRDAFDVDGDSRIDESDFAAFCGSMTGP